MPMPEIMRLERIIGNFSVIARAGSTRHSLLPNPTTAQENATTLRSGRLRSPSALTARAHSSPPPTRLLTSCTPAGWGGRAGPARLRLSVTSGVLSGGLMETRRQRGLSERPGPSVIMDGASGGFAHLLQCINLSALHNAPLLP